MKPSTAYAAASSALTDDWRHQALCRRTDRAAFFPLGAASPARAAVDRATTFCGFCPVRKTCAVWAVTENMEFGVWGGLSEDTRRSIRRHATPEQLQDPEEVGDLVEQAWTVSLMDSLVDAYLARTEQDDNGHVRWLGRRTISVRGRVLTSAQLAFEVGYGRQPQGQVKPTCGRELCAAAEHLADAQMRRQLTRRAA